MKKSNYIVIIIILIILFSGVSILLLLFDNPTNVEPIQYTFKIEKIYDHDQNAFTQGLIFNDGVLFESTGLYGHSSLRRVDLETGNILQLQELSDEFFGEGITIFEDKIIQLTWKNKIGFVYNKDSFQLLQEFEYSTDGWGITHDDTSLIMSNGSSVLFFLDPETFTIFDQIEVYDLGPVKNLNELEYIEGKIYANIWLEKKIAIIDPLTGKVTGWINLENIDPSGIQYSRGVLNGIAYDSKENRLFVTGKNWSKLFEISLIPQ
ncbi:MAG: glutaminyl-peptide cyclotransferase [Candidatus Bathyarchaeota archaeon]